MATYCILRDGTKYIILPATIGGMKGHKYTDVFIQEGIDEDFIYDEIFPGLYMEDKRVPQITYWERGD
jgi:hypothetical protein